MDFGIMFFASAGEGPGQGKYRFLIQAVRFADVRGFTCVWTPERHFHPFGGLFPNPAVTSAALAMITSRLQIRAGSLISPLHDPIRIAEDWSVVDNLSEGRAAISFGSGWNVDDFVFFPERYARRQEVMYEQIERVRELWRGGAVTAVNSFGHPVELRLYPRPVQPELPVWVTSSGNDRTFASAGRIGANVLTHLIGQDLESLARSISVYREARRESGFDPRAGKVSLMLHTFLGTDLGEVKETVRAPFSAYIESAVSLEQKAAAAGGTISGGHRIEPHELTPEMLAGLLDLTFERYFERAALMGTPETCRRFVWELKETGVDEIACLLDFGVPHHAAMRSLEILDELRASFSAEALGSARQRFTETFAEDLDF